MRFVEEEHQLWFLGIANLGQSLEELGQHPKQKGCVEFRCVDEFVGSKNVDDAPSFRVRLHHIVEIERRFAKEVITALLFERQQRTLDGSDAGRRDVAVLGFELSCVITDMLQHRAQVFEIEQQETVVVGNFENESQHSALSFIELEQPRHEQGAHIGNGCPDGMPLLAVKIPENCGVSGILKVFDSKL